MTDTADLYRPAWDSQGHEYDPRVIRPPADTAPYPHSAECRTPEREPAWELVDLATRLWRRGPCNGHQTCAIVQHHDPRASVPAPPRPAEDDGRLVAFLTEHGRAHVTVELVVAPGDVLAHWQARCANPECRQVEAWRHEPAEHYRAAGLTLWGVGAGSSTPLGPVTLEDVIGPP
jgi:hypothetical protein